MADITVDPGQLVEIVENVLGNIPIEVSKAMFEFGDGTTFQFERDSDTWLLAGVY